MQLLEKDIHTAKALVIDANATTRSIMATQLRDLGVHQVRQIGRVQDARLALEGSTYDVVLCEMNFDGGPMSGQDLLDELRREQLLPYSTIFILVTGEATYARVLEAAEATVDGYLVKPYSGSSLAERLHEARRRKRTLKEIYEAIQRREFARGAALAEARFDTREPYWMFAGQLAAELWFKADQPARALRICSAVVEERAQPWAHCGLARARLALGESGAARRLLEALVAQAPDYADARDLLARLLVEQGEFNLAIDEFRACASLTPGCLLRMQHYGTLAFYMGQKEEAHRMLERTVATGRKSKLFDALSLMLLALLKFDFRETRGAAVVLDHIAQMCEAYPNSSRLRRMHDVATALSLLQQRKVDEALVIARALAGQVMSPRFDLEAAALTVSLWSRLPNGEVPAKELDTLLRSGGLRFCVSKACTEVLAASADKCGNAEETLRNCHTVITNIAEQALNRSLAGEPAVAVEMLLQQGAHTRNAKLIEMAGAVARRHAKALPDVDGVLARVKELQAEWCQALSHIAGVRRSARMPGGVVLRT